MPHYFFATRCNSEDFVRDEAGLELDNIEAARDEATRGLADLARDTLPGATRRELAIDATATSGQLKRREHTVSLSRRSLGRRCGGGIARGLERC